MLKDLQHGIRVLLQAKGWTVVVVLSLAVGIGATAAVFTAVNATLLKKLPVDDPDSLVRLRVVGRNDMVTDSSDYGFTVEGSLGPVRTTFSYTMYQQLLAANRTLVGLVASVPVGRTMATIDGQAETVTGMMVSGNFHRLLGVRARIGRTIEPADDRPAAPPVVMLGERYWRTRFAGDPAVLGRTITISGIAATIIGITPAEFTGTQLPTSEARDVTLPLALDPRVRGENRLDSPTDWFVQIMGRLKPGVTFEQVQGNLGEVFRTQARAGLDAYLAAQTSVARNTAENRNRVHVPALAVETGSRGIYDANTNDVRALEIIGMVVVLVLLLVCANIANLLLSRAALRQRELSVRLSIGATRARLIRQLLTESLLLAATGGTLGLLLAHWGQMLLPPPIGATGAAMDVGVVGAMAVLTALVGLGFGIAPAFQATRVDVGTALKESSRSVAGASPRLRNALLVAQVSISVLLLIGAGLFLRTVNNLIHVDIGYDPNNLVFVRTLASTREYSAEDRTRFFEEGVRRLQAVPGVRAATLSVPTLLSGSVNGTRLFVQGRQYAARGDSSDHQINRLVVAPNFFATMGISLVTGRDFTERDHAKAPKVMIINQAAAKKFFPGENPIGQHVGYSVETTGDLEVVGILRDVRYNSLREPPPPTLYVPYAQRAPEGLIFSVRTVTDPALLMGAIRRAVGDVNPGIPIVGVETQVSQIERRFAHERVLAQASSLFSGIALFVAAIGLFGLLSYNVSRRTREIGIRMAMGAPREAVLLLVLHESMVLVAAGIVIGIAVALAAGRLIASQLFGLEPTDGVTLIAAIATMTVVSAAAGYLPARRATRVDPMVALRYE